MKLSELKTALANDPNAALHWMLPDGDFVPPHFHVTEVGRVRKDFVDCGGVRRSTSACVLQLWTADDTDHRLVAGRLGMILGLADDLFENAETEVEVEYDRGVLANYPLGGIEFTPAGLLFHLGAKHSACLAPERCGVPGTAAAGCC